MDRFRTTKKEEPKDEESSEEDEEEERPSGWEVLEHGCFVR